MKTHKERSRPAFASKKGSVLITAAIFSTISIVTIASFLKLANHELRLSNNQFYTNQSLNLAEAGLDEAMHLLSSENTSGWTVSDGDARFTAGSIAIGRGATGTFDVLVEDWEGTPIVVAEGRVTSGSGLTATKQVKMSLRPRSYFANGITARCHVVFKGGVSYVESYRSSEGFVGEANYIRRDRAAVATTRFEEDSLDVGNGHIWGYAFTGGGPIKVGPHGTVRGEDSDPTGPNVDPKRVARDFTAIFPRAEPPPDPTDPVDEPAVEVPNIDAWLAANGISRTSDQYVDSSNLDRGTYQANYGTINSSTILGIPEGSHSVASGRMVVYADRIDMPGGVIQVVGPVTLVVAGEMKTAGGAEIRIGFDSANKEGADLRIYSYGGISVTGSGGMKNFTRLPNNLAIFGMAADQDMCLHSQTFTLGGNGSWEAVVYAPNADITLSGGGTDGFMAGAVVGMSVKINGGSMFHYDEDTEAFLRGFGFAMESWEEVPKIDRISLN